VKLRRPCRLLSRLIILASCRFTTSKRPWPKKGVEFDRECLIFEVCQPQQAKKVLDQNMSVSTALPCRISIYEEGGKTILATLKPTILLAMFDSPQLKPVAQEVEDTIVKIMNEAATGTTSAGRSAA